MGTTGRHHGGEALAQTSGTEEPAGRNRDTQGGQELGRQMDTSRHMVLQAERRAWGKGGGESVWHVWEQSSPSRNVDSEVEKGEEEAECGPSLFVHKFVVNTHQNIICLRVYLIPSPFPVSRNIVSKQVGARSQRALEIMTSLGILSKRENICFSNDWSRKENSCGELKNP